MPFLTLTLLLAIHIAACDYWKPTQPFGSPDSPRQSQHFLISDDTRFNDSGHITLTFDWPPSAVNTIYF